MDVRTEILRFDPGATAPVVVRRVGERAIVTVLNGAQLLPELEPNARVLIASPTVGGSRSR